MPREDITGQEQRDVEGHAFRIKGDPAAPADVEGHGTRIRFEPDAPAEVEAHMPFRSRRGEEAEPAADETGREQLPSDAEDDVEAHRRKFR